MPAPVIEFDATVVGAREQGGLSIALTLGPPNERDAVAILLCSDETALSLAGAIRAALPT